jgi:hypothetical protein
MRIPGFGLPLTTFLSPDAQHNKAELAKAAWCPPTNGPSPGVSQIGTSPLADKNASTPFVCAPLLTCVTGVDILSVTDFALTSDVTDLHMPPRSSWESLN